MRTNRGSTVYLNRLTTVLLSKNFHSFQKQADVIYDFPFKPVLKLPIDIYYLIALVFQYRVNVKTFFCRKKNLIRNYLIKFLMGIFGIFVVKLWITDPYFSTLCHFYGFSLVPCMRCTALKSSD